MDRLFNDPGIDVNSFQKKRKPNKPSANPQNNPNKHFGPRKNLKSENDKPSNYVKGNSHSLKSGQFRFQNEYLYTTPSNESKQFFDSSKASFETYHEGYNNQIQNWPKRPLDVIVDYIEENTKRFEGCVIADLGCGLGELEENFRQKGKKKYRLFEEIHSYDLTSVKPHIKEVDIANLPQKDGSCGAIVFCLSQMGPNYLDFQKEATRVLKTGGTLMISEVLSRFQSVKIFVNMIRGLGYKMSHSEDIEKYFNFMVFTKLENKDGQQPKDQTMKGAIINDSMKLKDKTEKKIAKEFLSLSLEQISKRQLQPCIYKKR